MNSALEFILKRPLSVLLCIAGVTLPCCWILKSTQFSPSIIESFVDNQQEYLDAMELERQFAGNPDALLWLATDEGDRLFTLDRLSAIRQAAIEIRKLDGVARVTALPDLPRPPAAQRGLRGTTQKIILNAKLKRGVVPEQIPPEQPVLPKSGAIDDDNFAEVRRQLLARGSYTNRFLSANGNVHVMLIELENPYEIMPAQQVALVAELEKIVVANGLGEQGFYCSGLVALQAYAYEQIELVLFVFLPLGGLLISTAVMFVFRRVEVVLVTLLIAAISICWGTSLGLVAYGRFSVLLAAVPLMVLVISTADVIHLISSYTAERHKGIPHAHALRKTFREVGGACVLTSVTTFVGFASLLVVPSNTIRQFGFSAAAGVAGALLLSVIIIPLFLDWLARRGRPVVTTVSASRLTESTARICLAVALRWRWFVLGVFAVALLASGVLTSRLRLDPDLTRRFTKSHPVTISTRFFADHLGGINSVEILLRGEPERLLAPETLSDVQRFSQLCHDKYAASSVDSIASVLSEFLQQLDYRNSSGLAESEPHARAAVDYLARYKPELVARLMTDDRRQLRILIRIQQTSYMDMLDVSSAIADDARQHFGESFIVVEKGSAPLVGRAVREIIRGHLHGFILCFSAIFLLITFGLKSYKLGCLSVLPNLTPLLLLGGLIGCRSTVVDSDILAVASLGLGLAVDDTIHFLSRFRIELNTGKTVEEALAASMQHTGLAIIRTTLILSVGFCPFAFSGYWSISMLGTYLLLVLAAAVVADLVFLPAIVSVAYRHYHRPAESVEPA